jgi:hypothetical protein
MGRPAREPTDIIFGNVRVLLDLADNYLIIQALRLRLLHHEVAKFSADLLRSSYIKQAQGRHAVTFNPGDRFMLHNPFLPKYEDGKRIVSVPTRLLKYWSGDFPVVRQPNQSNVVLDIKGNHYVAHVARVLRYTPFVPTHCPLTWLD